MIVSTRGRREPRKTGAADDAAVLEIRRAKEGTGVSAWDT